MISESDQRTIASNTYKLELAEVDEVNNGNVTLGSVNLGFRKRDELTSMSAAAHSGVVVFSFTHLVEVDGGSVVVVLEEMVVTHTDLTEVTRVVLKYSKLAQLSKSSSSKSNTILLSSKFSFSISDKSSTHSYSFRRSRFPSAEPHPYPR